MYDQCLYFVRLFLPYLQVDTKSGKRIISTHEAKKWAVGHKMK